MLFILICFQKEHQMRSPARRNSGYALVYKHFIWKTASNLPCKLKERFCKDCDKTMGEVAALVRSHMNDFATL